MMNRTRIRSMFSIEGTLGEDCVVAFFCGRCSLMMQDREIRAREKYCCVVHNMEARQSFAVSRQPSLHQEMVAVPNDVHRKARKCGRKTIDDPQGLKSHSLSSKKVRIKPEQASVGHNCLKEASSGNFTKGMEGAGSVMAPLKAILRGDQPAYLTTKNRETIEGRQPWRSASGRKKQKSPGSTQGNDNAALYEILQGQEAARSGEQRGSPDSAQSDMNAPLQKRLRDQNMGEGTPSSHLLAECEMVGDTSTNELSGNQHR